MIKRAAWLLLLPTLAVAQDSGGGADFRLEVAIHGQVHLPGQPVVIDLSVCNPHDHAVEVTTACPRHIVEIIRPGGHAVAHLDDSGTGCGGIISNDRWAPGECRHRQVHWPQTRGAFGGGQAQRPVARGGFQARYTWRPNAWLDVTGVSAGFVAGERSALAVPGPGLTAMIALGLLLLTAAWRTLRD